MLGMTLWATCASAEVAIDGVNNAVERVLRGFLSIDELPCDSPRWWVGRRFKQAPAEIRQAMETLGFYSPRVQSDLQWQEACWHATFTVEQGPRTRVRALSVETDQPLGAEPRFLLRRRRSVG